MSVRPMLRSFTNIRRFPAPIRTKLQQPFRFAPSISIAIPRRYASSEVPENEADISIGQVEGLGQEFLKEIISQAPKPILDAVRQKAAVSGGQEFTAWLTLFTIQQWVKITSTMESDLAFHRNIRAHLDLMLTQAQLAEPRLECAIRIFILRSGLSARGEVRRVADQRDGHLSKLVSTSVARLEQLQQEVGPEGLGELFLPTLTVCARYAYVSATSGMDYKIALERFKYIYQERNSWKDEHHQFVEIISKADFYVWYAEILGAMGREEDKPQAREMLEIAAYQYDHADAYELLISFYGDKSKGYHRCLCALASQPNAQGAEAALLLGQLYSLPDQEFKELDKELQVEINRPLHLTAKETIPLMTIGVPWEVKKKVEDCLNDIMKEYSDLGVMPADPQAWTKLKTPARIFKALYWNYIAQLQDEEAYIYALNLVKEHNLLAEGLWSQIFQYLLWKSSYNRRHFIELYNKESQKAAKKRLHPKFVVMASWFTQQRPTPNNTNTTPG